MRSAHAQPGCIMSVARRLGEIRWNEGVVDNQALLAFYSPRTLRDICALRSWLMQRAPLDRTPDPVDDWIRMVAINRLSGHSPGFFSVYTLPPNQAVSAQAQLKIDEKRGQTPPDRDVKKLILRKSVSLLSDGPMASHPRARLTTRSAESTSEIGTSSIQLVVTSPPFLDVVQYAEDNWLRSWSRIFIRQAWPSRTTEPKPAYGKSALSSRSFAPRWHVERRHVRWRLSTDRSFCGRQAICG